MPGAFSLGAGSDFSSGAQQTLGLTSSRKRAGDLLPLFTALLFASPPRPPVNRTDCPQSETAFRIGSDGFVRAAAKKFGFGRLTYFHQGMPPEVSVEEPAGGLFTPAPIGLIGLKDLVRAICR